MGSVRKYLSPNSSIVAAQNQTDLLFGKPAFCQDSNKGSPVGAQRLGRVAGEFMFAWTAAQGNSEKGSMSGGWAINGSRAISATARVMCFSRVGSRVITKGSRSFECAGS